MATDGRPPVWTTILVVVGSLAMVALGLFTLAERQDGSRPDAAATTTASPSDAAGGTPSRTRGPTSAATPREAPTGTPTGTPAGTSAGTPSPSAVPLVTVDVLNQTIVTGLAGRTASVLAEAGWTVGRVDDATLGAPSSTLYVPIGLQAAADAFVAAFPAVQRTRPAFEGLAVDGLTLVLAQPDAELVVAALESSAEQSSAADVPAPVGTSP